MALVERTDRGNVVTIAMNRPDKLNALSRDLISQLTEEFRNVAAELAQGKDFRCLVLRSSTDKAFCVGADLAERSAMSEAQVIEALDSLRDLMSAVENIQIPTIALLKGAAFGGGLELALCCDLRVAHSAASMGLTETRLAIIPGAGGTQRLTRLVGQAKAKEWIFLATKLSAADAEKFGLVNVQSENPDSVVQEWTSELSKRGPLALRAAKIAVDKCSDGRVSADALKVERDAYGIVLKSKDRLEGLKAFIEKRDPVYRGD